MKILKERTVFLGYEKESCFYKKKNHNFIAQINFLQTKVIILEQFLQFLPRFSSTSQTLCYFSYF